MVQDGPQSSPNAGVRPDLTVVGIGASAGGLEAASDLLSALPRDTGMAFVVVQHLDPDHESILGELLAKQTEMPVLQIDRDTPVESDHVYVIPQNTGMVIEGRVLRLTQRGPGQVRPIDVFLTSLAKDLRSNAIGVILSGTASDGTSGLRAIKKEEGITFAQDSSAKFDSMPQSAIAAGAVDFVLPPKMMARELARIAQHPFKERIAQAEMIEGDPLAQRAIRMLRGATGVDFTQYKQPTLMRRISRRVILTKSDGMESYLELLEREPAELQALFEDVLINVTEFFRDPEVFASLKRVMFPRFIDGRDADEPIRIWVPACSTGEEVYSIAIALTEFLEEKELAFPVQIFGTDVSERSIDRARLGIYDASSIEALSKGRATRFFTRVDRGYRVSRQIRELCVFSRHNIAKDPRLSRMDFVSFRNLLIYFSTALQGRVIANLGMALRPNGCLLLGASETLGSMAEYFSPLEDAHKIFCRKPNAIPAALEPSEWFHDGVPYQVLADLRLPLRQEERRAARPGTSTEEILSPHDETSAVILNEALKIVQTRGNMAPYLVAKGDSREADIFQAVRPEIAEPLRKGIAEARRGNGNLRLENIVVRHSGELRRVQVTIVAVTTSPTTFVLLFESNPGKRDASFENGHAASVSDPHARVTELEHELATTREYLQSIIEELRSTNEEAQSVNEELQSTNEEMQTAREELQSTNEELNTVNKEMQSRNRELSRTNDDLENLLISINMPIVITTGDLRIRRFTPMAEKVLHLIAADTGRPISDLRPRINVDNLSGILGTVVETLVPFEQEVLDQDGNWFLMRVRPYLTADRRIEGAILQLHDLGELKRTLERVRRARNYAQAIVDTVREPLVVLDHELAIQNANRAFYEYLHVQPTDVAAKKLDEVNESPFSRDGARDLISHLRSSGTQINDVEITVDGPAGGERVFLVNARRLVAEGNAGLVLLAFEDTTERKRASEARYRRLFESARDGIIILDAETGEVLDLNPYVEQLLGFERERLVGRRLWEIEPMQHAPEIWASLERIRDQGVVPFADLTLDTRDGRRLQTEVIANTYREKERWAIQLNIRDLTERKKFERELQQTQKLESLGLLAGGVAHDFNNLLTGILGNASLAMSDTPADEPVRKYLREIVDAAERAAFLTRQMLAYAGKGRFVTHTLDLGDLIREISTLIRTSIPKTAEIRLELAPDLPAVDADPGQMQQLVMNLVINGAEAIAENRPGTVEVRTSLRVITEEDVRDKDADNPLIPGKYVCLEVKDTGVGMDEATRARIFDPFFTTKFTGRGLGLAATLGIVKGHRGSIRVYSAPGRGTSFSVLIPASAKKPRAPMRGRVTKPSGLKGTVLVIDDEEMIRNLARTVLTRQGFEVLTANHGTDGVKVFRENLATVSVVLLDLLMPEMGGEQTMEELQAIRPEIPVILSSGFDESEANRRFAGKKLAGFVQKPYDAERLVQAIVAAIKSEAKGGPDAA